MKSCPACGESYADSYAHCPRDGSALVASSGWTEGAVVRGKYRILAKVGQGGMGEVYKALHLRFNEVRALKVMSTQLASDSSFVRRFEQEAVNTRRLQHPSAVRVDDIDESEDGRPFIVMEYIEGRSLKSLIEAEGPQPVERTCRIIRQAASALGAAHELGMVHRDIKPENIVLISNSGGEQAKVLDFGIAKLKEAAPGQGPGLTLTGTGVVIGTPQYMSPEQALGKRGDELDGRSDLYSLGIVMYQMLSGELPFKADTTVEMLMAHLQMPPALLHEVRPDLTIPEPVAAVVMRCLEKNREQRPASAHVLIQEIEDAEEAASASSQSTRRVVVEPLPASKVPVEHAEVDLPKPEPPRLLPRKQSPEPDVRPKAAIVRTVRSNLFRVLFVVALLLIITSAFGLWWLWTVLRPDVLSPESSRGNNRGEVIGSFRGKKNPKDGLTYVWIPSGTFTMGCSPGDSECKLDEEPAHQVTVSKEFWVGQTEVTVDAYRRFADGTGRPMPSAPAFNSGWSIGQLPVVNVTWEDAQAYCSWVGGRLPTEAEWEYAARGGSTEARYGPLDEIAWYSATSGSGARGVATKRANGIGLFDMLGNEWEWTGDWWADNYYANSPATDPSGPPSGTLRVLRGGSWYSAPRFARASERGPAPPDYRGIEMGFRCVSELIP